MRVLKNTAIGEYSPLIAFITAQARKQLVAAEGETVVSLNRADWEAFVAAVEIAFDDETSIPEGMKPAADRLWQATHPDPRNESYRAVYGKEVL